MNTNYMPACNTRFAPATSWNRVVESFLDDAFRSPAFASDVRYDVYTDKQNYYVDVELPGVKKHNVHVSVEGDSIKVSAEYTEVESQFLFIRRERPVGKVEKEFRIGKNLDSAKLEARFEDGILHLTLPVKAEAAARMVDIK